MAKLKLVIPCLLLGIFLCANSVLCRSGYVLTLPQELQLGAEETFCLSLFNVTTDVQIHLNISCYGQIEERHPEVFTKGSYNCFTWTLPSSLTAGTCELQVEGEGEDGEFSFSDSQELEVVDTHQITFVQTDRPVYKPGDTVQFRILTVTQDLLPVLKNVESVVIQDPQEFYMKRWSDLQVKSGLVSLDYKLYEEPVLGEWKIVTVVNGRKTEQTFMVQKYVLPKFEVTMTLPKTLTVATKNLQFEVCANYTFGKPVKGELDARVCLVNTQTSWFCEKNVRPCAKLNTKIDGCHQFAIETSKLNITDRRFSLLCKPNLVLSANVTEKNSGEIVQTDETGTDVWEQRVKMRFIGNKYFKPYFPYHAKLLITEPDGSPAVHEKIELNIGKLGIKLSLTSDKAGYVNFTIQNLTHNTDFFVLNAKTLDESLIDTKLYTIFPAKAKMYVKQWYSPTSSYIHLTTNKDEEEEEDEAYNCGDKINVNVLYSLMPDTYVEKLMYQVISKGDILLTKDITATVSQSMPYKHKKSGLTFTPKLVKKETDTEDSPFSANSPQGPAKSDNTPAGPPGRPGSPMAGPPGKNTSTGAGKAPVAPLTGVDITDDDEERVNINTDLSGSSPDQSEAPELWKIPLTLSVSDQMSPRLRLLVYLVTDTGEMVADTRDFSVNYCHKNKVKMTIKEKSKRPGEKVTLSITAAPQSLCSASLVDRGVYLLGGNNLLLQSYINQKLEQFDLTSDFISDWQYCSDMSDLPPVLSAGGPTHEIGSPGSYEDIDISPGPFRKKRSIMQFHSNMYDSLLAFKVAGVRALSNLDLQTRPCLHDGSQLGPPRIPGEPIGPVPGPGGMEDLESPHEPKDIRPPTSKFRRHFPDTWLWDLFEIPSSGTITVNPTLPGSITQWVGNSFCTNAKNGLAVSNIASVTSFQPFFLSVKLPYSVVRGELVHVNLEVFNYLEHCIAVYVVLAKNGDFIVEGDPEAEPNFCICKGQSKGHVFKVRPQVLGKINLTFSAVLKEHRTHCHSSRIPYGFTNKQVTDVVVKQLRVEAEGVEEEHTRSFYICPKDFPDGIYEKHILPTIPENLLVKDSLRSWISVIGHVRSNTIRVLVVMFYLFMYKSRSNTFRVLVSLTRNSTFRTLVGFTWLQMSRSRSNTFRVLEGQLSDTGFTDVHTNGGDIMGPVLNGLETLVLLPTGCGEQNMVRLAPNIAILEYLTVTQQLTDDVEARTLDHLQKGYQQQMKFMHDNGAFSAFGEADDHGSTWLSAFVFKTLRQASYYIYIDRKQILTQAWNFLINQQGEDGCFEETGKVLSKYMTGGVVGSKEHRKKALTAYILAAMLESFQMMRERTPPFVALAVRCIQVDSLNDTYTLALTAYAMTLYKPNSRFTTTLVTRLWDKVTVEDDMMYWKRDFQPRILSGQGRAASAEVEITSYALLAFLTKDKNIPINKIIPIVRWLTSQRNAYGGFASTQDTVVALQALSVFARRIYGAGLNVDVSITNGDYVSMDFRVSRTNSIILQQQNLPIPDASLNVTAKGEGCLLLQVTSRYNLMNSIVPVANDFTLSVTTPVTQGVINNNCRTRKIRVCARYTGDDKKSDMAIVEVKLVSGWIPNVTSLDRLLNSAELGLKKYEMDLKHPDVVNFYFDEITSRQLCFTFDTVLEVEVEHKQLAVAKVFDYYDTDFQATTFYELSACSAELLEEVDVSLDDLFIEEDKTVVVHKIQAEETEREETAENNVPAPKINVGCPQCITTGTVNILQGICEKQVWKLEPEEDEISMQIIEKDSVSPRLSIPIALELDQCSDCKASLLKQGAVSLAILEPYNWKSLGLNIANPDTVIIPWSEGIQQVIQQTLKSCFSAAG